MPQLIDNLHQILTTTIANPRFYFARMLGFRSELEIQKYFSERGEIFLEGGQFLFCRKEMTKNRLVYITVANDDYSEYLDFYKKIASLPMVKEYYFISYSESGEWGSCDFKIKRDGTATEIEIAEPNFKFFKFDGDNFIECNKEDIVTNLEEKTNTLSCCKQKENKLQYIQGYSLAAIDNVYANRFFLDVFLRKYKKGMIDFDGIIKKDEDFYLLESKEKDPAGQGDKRYFGWDSRRLAWYLYLKWHSGLKTIYIIRQVNNQTERRFVDWKYITLDDFAESASWLSESGGGGGSGTMTAPFAAFKKLDDLVI